MKNILVTGGTGFIGSHTCVKLIENDYNVIIMDNLSNSKAETVDKIEQITGKRPLFYKADMLVTSAVEKIPGKRYFCCNSLCRTKGSWRICSKTS